MSELQRTLREELARTRGDLEPELIEIRRNFHREPELRFEEHHTAQTVEELLRPLELSVRPGVAGTGPLADLPGEQPRPTIALPADLGALTNPGAEDVPHAFPRDGGIPASRDRAPLHIP